MELLKQRSQDIDVQIRKHQARLHVVESKYSETDDERFLVEVCKAKRLIFHVFNTFFH